MLSRDLKLNRSVTKRPCWHGFSHCRIEKHCKIGGKTGSQGNGHVSRVVTRHRRSTQTKIQKKTQQQWIHKPRKSAKKFVCLECSSTNREDKETLVAKIIHQHTTRHYKFSICVVEMHQIGKKNRGRNQIWQSGEKINGVNHQPCRNTYLTNAIFQFS